MFLGTAGDHVPHRHHAVQIAIGVRHPVRLWAERPGELCAPGVVIAADHAHQLTSGPEPLLLLYLERESNFGRMLDDWCGSRARPMSVGQSAQFRSLLDTAQPELGTLGRATAQLLTSAPPANSFSDSRVAKALANLPSPLPESITAATLGPQVGLSPSRFAHLFREHAGMPLRPYLRWLRLQSALVGLARGCNLTEAAYAAGFSDSAHLSRTFRRTFGIAPSVLLHPGLSLRADGDS